MRARRGATAAALRLGLAAASAVLGVGVGVGATCAGALLDLEPAPPPASQAFWNTSLDTWGGSVIEDGDGRYHLYAAAMAGGCGLAQWGTNSFVMHAVADNPAGPFARVPGAAGTAVGVWAHNPQVVRHTDGTFLMFTISKGNATDPCLCSEKPVPPGFCPRPRWDPWVESTQLHYAGSLDGPWTLLGRVISGSNPSPAVVASTGEVYVAFKPGFQIARAAHWRGPYKTISPLKPFEGHGLLPAGGPTFPLLEDAFLWHDPASRRWNCLFHQYPAEGGRPLDGPGGFAYSAVDDILNWTWATPGGGSVYGFAVRLQDNSSLALQKRERPKLLLDRFGQPSVLYNGVVAGAGGDAHTFAQRVRAFNPPYRTQPALSAR